MKKIVLIWITFFLCNGIDAQTNSIPALTTSKSYGYKKNNPIKVGGGVYPSNVYDYLNNLRGVNGEEIEFERIGSGPSYPNPDPSLTPFKQGVLTMFKVRVKGSDVWKTIYFDQYRFEEPKVIMGFGWKMSKV